jgi:hypothetical protein
LRVTARTSTREWSIPTDEFQSNRWQFVEIGWSEQTGLVVYINNKLVGRAGIPTVREAPPAQPAAGGDGGGAAGTGARPEQEPFQLGRGDGTQANSRFGSLTVDDFEYWYGNRDYLLAFDYIQRGA